MFYVGSGPKNNFFNMQSGNKYYSEFVIDENDGNSQFAILAKSVEKDSKILDVGCADGKFGSFLKSKKNAVMYGVDINAEALEQARKTNSFEDVYEINLEWINENDPEYKRYFSNGIEYDYIVLTDVLEHIPNPTRLLINAAQRLKINGKILISIPNIAHADIWLNLMNGVFNYTDCGILDNTHLKFFTKNSFCEWISSINSYYESDVCFDCKFVGNTHLESEILDVLKVEKSQFYQFVISIPNYNAIQFLFVITKKEKGSKTPELDNLLAAPKGNAVDNLFKIFKESELIKQINIHLNQEIVRLGQEIIRLDSENMRLNRENSQLLGSVDSLTVEKNELLASVDALTQNLQQTAETLNAIRSSKSYRLYHMLRRK